MRVWVLGICLLLGAVTLPSSAFAAPATVNTSSSASATTGTAQRKTFFDTVSNVHWAFYYNGTAIEYSYSADGTTWTSAGTLPYNTASFSVAFKTINTTSYVFLVAEGNSYDVLLRRGALGATSITFGAELTVFDGSSASNLYTKPTVAISENNHLWISTIKDFGVGLVERYLTQVKRSTNLADGDLSTFQAATPLGRSVESLRSAVIVPRSGDGMSVVTSVDGNSIVGFVYDGTNWSSANTGGDYSWFGFPRANFMEFEEVYAVAVSGTDVYIAGTFWALGGNTDASYVARWDGTKWNALGDELSGIVLAIAVSGSNVYIGGAFQNAGGIAEADRIARWDGTSYNALGNGASSNVRAIFVSGSDVYIGGDFADIGGLAAGDRIARWDGSNWNALGSGIANGTVLSIAVTGANVYVGGTFLDAGGNTSADRIGRWNGTSWNALGSGLGATVRAIAVTGTDVYVGGDFVDAGGNTSADRIARWNGTSWNALNTGVNSTVFSIKISGSNIYAAGLFTDAGGNTSADRIAYWNGSSWNAVGTGITGTVNDFAVSGSDIYAGGYFTGMGANQDVDYFAKWNGTSWGGLTQGGIDDYVLAITVDGSDVYVGGNFDNAGGIAAADKVARWDGSSWHALGSGLNDAVEAIAVSGGNVYVGGEFTDAGGIAAADYIVRWDGASWNAVGSGLNDSVLAIETSGSDIYIGGYFTDAGGIAAADRIVRWDGSNWNALGAGLTGAVYSIAIAGSDIYVGGQFTDAGGIGAADRIARWNGTTWNALGSGVSSGDVHAIAVSGSDVYIGGGFASVGGVAGTNRIARWDGANWNALGSGLSNNYVEDIKVIGGKVYVGGSFPDGGGFVGADGLIIWNGTTWERVDSNTSFWVYAIAAKGDQIYFGGDIGVFPDLKAAYFLAYYAPAVATDASKNSAISVTSDPSNGVYLNYTDSAGNVKFRRYDNGSGTWGTKVTLNNAVSTSPSLSFDTASSRLVSSWVESNTVKYKVAASPYAAANWNGPVTIYNTGVNAAARTAARSTSSNMLLEWTNGNSNPYSVFADFADLTAPTVAISSTATSPTRTSPIPVTFQFSETVTGFAVGDITVGNGSVGNFAAVDGDTYTADITPSGQGAITVDVAAAVAQDSAFNDNTAATQFSITYDSVAPTVVISSTATSPTPISPIPVTFQFSETVTGFVVGDITVGNGSAGNFVAVDGDTYTADITPSGQGAVTVDVAGSVAQDGAGNNNSAATQFSITYDTVAPTVAISSSLSSPTATSPIPVTFQFSETVTGFVVGDITVGNGSAGNFVAVDGDTYTADITPSGQGAVTVDVAGSVAQDGAGNNNSAATQFSITYDTVAPTVAISSSLSSPTTTSPIPVTFQFSETVTGFVVGDITVGNGSAGNFVAVDGDTYTVDITPSGQGAVTVDVAGSVAQDGAGNNNSAATQLSVTYDTVAPTVAVSSSLSSPTSTSPISVTFQFSETVTGFVVGDITVGDGSAGNFVAVDGDTYTADITPSGQGAVTVDVAGSVAQDGAGNNNSAATQFSVMYDSVAPTIIISSSATNPTNDSPFEVTFQFSEKVSGFVAGDVTLGNSTLSNFVAVDGDTYTADVTPTTDGLVTVNVAANKCQDAAGNNNTAAVQLSRVYDNTVPTVSISAPTVAIKYSNRNSYSLVGSCSENGRTVLLNATSSAGGAAVTSSANCTAGSWSKSLNMSGLNDGTVTITADHDDAVGLDAAQASRMVTKDTVSPTGVIATSVSSPTNTNPIPITIEFSKAVSGFTMSDISVINGSAANFVAIDADSFTANIIPTTSGEIRVHISANAVQDVDGNDNTVTNQLAITYDGHAPSVGISSTLSSPTKESSIPVVILFSESVFGFDAGDVTVQNATLSGFVALSAKKYRAILSPIAEGAVTARIAAGVAQDSVGNSNSASSQFLIEYTLQELESEPDTVCSVWNGFFDKNESAIWNILEHVNTGEKSIAVETTLYSFDGVAKSTAQFSIEAGRQLDLLVHDMKGWLPDSYGLVCSKIVHGERADLDGRMVYYKQKQSGGFEYIFAAPLSRGLRGTQFVGFNTHQPSLNVNDSDNFVANWIRITNLEGITQKGNLFFYDQAGNLLKHKAVTIPAKGQSDNSAHEWDGPKIGLVKWVPAQSDARFILRNTRYLYDNAEMQDHFQGAFQVQGSQGSNEKISAILDTRNASSIIELANISNHEQYCEVKFYSEDGDLLQNFNMQLPAHGSWHLIADGVLIDDLGSVTVRVPGAKTKNIIANVLQYGRDSNGSIEYLYAIEAVAPTSEIMHSSYNTFLNQSCELYILNQKDSAQVATISMQRNNGTQVFENSEIVLGAGQTMVSNICSAESEAAYGVVTLSTESNAAINSFLLRTENNGSNRYPIPVR